MSNKQHPVGEKNNLPLNIENATPDYVRDHLADWDKQILERRAEQLGVSVEEARRRAKEEFRRNPKPLLLIEAERQAQAEGTTVDAILEEYESRLRRPLTPEQQTSMSFEIVPGEHGSRLGPAQPLQQNAATSILRALRAKLHL
jgi:hypothetical protein